MTTYDDYGIPVGAYAEPEGLGQQAWRQARALLAYCRRHLGGFRRLATLANALVLLWAVVLYWGERGVFDGAVDACHWDRWEAWETDANAHRLLLIADPQLIDPHTYPGRPWPLNPLAYRYTDAYMRRAYTRLQTRLRPDTLFLLGDLFDGGREWATRTTTSPDPQFRRYGNALWLDEYRRFGRIFVHNWHRGGNAPRPGQPGRRFITSLPGNHDLGFGRGVQRGVRDRFQAYFGDGNRIDIIANHSFVSLDTPSLSALAQPDPDEVTSLWQPTRAFLDTAKTHKHRLTQRQLRLYQGLPPTPRLPHHVISLDTADSTNADPTDTSTDTTTNNTTDFPTILLSHIPLYRPPGTPCGPLRERWPPTPPPSGHPPLESDDRNAIAVRGGYQYQNVLEGNLSATIAEKVGDIQYAFSGDDHDYCEVLHRGYASAAGGIKEITVKSVSWAMGVRRPGVVLVSLWNPVDKQGKSVGKGPKTVQTKLCLLPDQIGTFLRYAMLFAVTVMLLAVRAALVAAGMVKVDETREREGTLLPITNPFSSFHDQEEKHVTATTTTNTSPLSPSPSHSSNSSTGCDTNRLQSRPRASTLSTLASASTTPVTTNIPPPHAPSYPYPLINHAGFYPKTSTTTTATSPPTDSDKVREKQAQRNHAHAFRRMRQRRSGMSLFWYEVRRTLMTVVGWGGMVYVGLLWWG